jgi:hypothetical protein
MTAGRGAAPAGLDDVAGHSGRIGAPPGITNTQSPCQELTDDLASRPAGLKPVLRGKTDRKRGPMPIEDAANEHALLCCATGLWPT